MPTGELAALGGDVYEAGNPAAVESPTQLAPEEWADQSGHESRLNSPGWDLILTQPVSCITGALTLSLPDPQFPLL